jgi:hypothetical protein
MKVRIVLVALVAALILFSLPVLASEAPWWEWRNLTTRDIVCAQTSPGKDWVKYTGPYADLKCTTRGTPPK